MARTIISDSSSAGGLGVYGSIEVGGAEVVDATGGVVLHWTFLPVGP